MSKKTPPIIKQPGQPGRPPVAWDQLYNEWLKSKKTKREFLTEYGFSLQSSTVKQMIAAWSRDEKTSRARMGRLVKSQQTPEKHISGLWQVVQQWRAGQAEADWKTADNIRSHLKLILNNAVVMDDDGKPHSKLTPRDLVNVADALETLQKVQRLALGMSTENVGVDRPDDGSHVESGDDELGVPIFEVQISDNGKFKRARPILINGGK